jgi:hypothetical protein
MIHADRRDGRVVAPPLLGFRAPGRVRIPLVYLPSSARHRHAVLAPLGQAPDAADVRLVHRASHLADDAEQALLVFPGAWLRIAGCSALHPQPVLDAVLGPVSPDADFAWLAGPPDALPWARRAAEGLSDGDLVEISPVVAPTAHARLACAARLPASVFQRLAGIETLHSIHLLRAAGALLLLAAPGPHLRCDPRPSLLCAWTLDPA